MTFRMVIAATLAAFFMIPSSGNAQVLMQRDVSLRMALTIAEAALASVDPGVCPGNCAST